MEIVSGIADPSWTAIFGIALAIVLFTAKFVMGRAPTFDDVIVGLAEIPGELSGACCSLLIALLSISRNSQRLSIEIILVILVFILNVCVFRLAERNKLSLQSNWKKVALGIAFSYSACILISFNVVSWSYRSMGQ